MQKFREIIIRPDVKLPALSTEQPERAYSFLNFLTEWVLGARGLREDENLPHFFEWEEAIEAFTLRMETKAGVEPVLPFQMQPPELKPGRENEETNGKIVAAFKEVAMAAQAAHKAASDAYGSAVSEAASGERIYVTDEAFLAGRIACKDFLDAATTPNPQGGQLLPKAYEGKVLRHYHALTMSKAIEERDVPDVSRDLGLG